MISPLLLITPSATIGILDSNAHFWRAVNCGTDETPGSFIIPGDGFQYKEYRGMSSAEVISRNRNIDNFFVPAPEGISTRVRAKGSAKYVIENLRKGLQSGMSYCNAKTINQIYHKAKWNIQTINGLKEGSPHILNK